MVLRTAVELRARLQLELPPATATRLKTDTALRPPPHGQAKTERFSCLPHEELYPKSKCPC